jgi:phosphopantothenoylcysteine synthetase/decarboxylase
VLIPDPDDAIHFVLAQYLRVPGRDDAGRRPMATADTSPVLYVIACGAGPARQLPAFVRAAQREGWDVCVITTPAGATFLDADRMAELTGHPVRVRYKHPDEPDVLPPADAFAIAPATFNTINKLAAGISDTLALGLLNEAVGLGLPVVAAPWPNSALARHPVFQASVARLRDWGVRVILDPSRLPGAGDEDAAVFPWPELHAALPSLRGYDAP